MGREELSAHLQKNAPVTPQDMDHFFRLATLKKCKKNEVILAQNQDISPLIFIGKGCLMTYHADRKGFKHVIQFGMEGWWTGDIRSMQEKKVSF
jgi:CRP-like cAMP-binding protein